MQFIKSKYDGFVEAINTLSNSEEHNVLVSDDLYEKELGRIFSRMHILSPCISSGKIQTIQEWRLGRKGRMWLHLNFGAQPSKELLNDILYHDPSRFSKSDDEMMRLLRMESKEHSSKVLSTKFVARD